MHHKDITITFLKKKVWFIIIQSNILIIWSYTNANGCCILTLQQLHKFECTRLDKVFKGHLPVVDLWLLDLYADITCVFCLISNGIFIFECINKCCAPVFQIFVIYLLYICQCKAEDGMPYVVRFWQYGIKNTLTKLTQYFDNFCFCTHICFFFYWRVTFYDFQILTS